MIHLILISVGVKWNIYLFLLVIMQYIVLIILSAVMVILLIYYQVMVTVKIMCVWN